MQMNVSSRWDIVGLAMNTARRALFHVLGCWWLGATPDVGPHANAHQHAAASSSAPHKQYMQLQFVCSTCLHMLLGQCHRHIILCHTYRLAHIEQAHLPSAGLR